jgi:tRNA(His) 5'-end guanylyltransferase
MMDSLGDRMKVYEATGQRALIQKLPVVVRVDGRAFHTFTRDADKPYDDGIIRLMLDSAKYVADGMQNFIMGYVQSDEASFMMNNDATIESQPWFNNNQQKIVSITASRMTARFNDRYAKMFATYETAMCEFDSRAFNLPEHEIPNYFYWRYKDWIRNSLSMFARSFFSQKQLEGKNREDVHEMLHNIGHNWISETTEQQRNGTFLLSRQGKIAEFSPMNQLNYSELLGMYNKTNEERIEHAQEE